MHLNLASDILAIVSTSEPMREQLAALLVERSGARQASRPKFDTADHHWPAQWTTWLAFSPSPNAHAIGGSHAAGLPYAAAAFPKLSVLIDADVAHRGADKLQWST